jgi:hypothetical protein
MTSNTCTGMVIVFTNKIFKGRIYFRSARWDTNDDAPKPLTRDQAREVLERRIPRRVQFNLQLRNLLRENFIISIEERKIAYDAPRTILSFTVRNVLALNKSSTSVSISLAPPVPHRLPWSRS